MFGFVILTAGILSGTLALRPYIYYLIKIRKPVSRHIPDKIIEYPNISIVINAYKEGELVAERIRDICNTEYPLDKITLYVFNDGADSATSNAAKRGLPACPFETHLIEPEIRLGKTACQNKAISLISDEIIVFTDADITTKPDALMRLVDALSEDGVGAVCADLIPVGSNSSVTNSESAYRSVYGKMCEYDSFIDSTYNFNGPLIAFKKSAVPNVEETRCADDANLALACIRNGFRALYVSEAVAFELQPVSLKEQFSQKIRRADGLVNSTRLFKGAGKNSERKFWRETFPIRKWMLLYSPILFIVSAVLGLVGVFLLSPVHGCILLILSSAVLLFTVLKPKNLISSFVMNQFFLTVGLIRRKNILQWDRVEK
ncbi:MAG TPA: glycosyltransferase [Methanocorpusculum sp.]|nr:glycosyltransferase [Methanocorpusculum sp.]